MAKKILVVDDEPLILAAVERALTKVGYAVSAIETPIALQEVLLNAPFDLLITDVYMEGESAESIAERVRCTSPGLRVIMMSGISNRGKYKNFIEKPFSIVTLRKMVKELLDESS